MITPKIRKQSKANKAAVSERPHAIAAVQLSAGASQELVRARAYEIYESRGNKNGQDKQDWFHAEQEILAI